MLHDKNKIIWKFSLFFGLLFLMVSCVETSNKVIPDDKINPKINTMHQLGSILVAYKKNTTIQKITNFENKLPKHKKKSLGSKVMFSYSFSSEDDIKTAESLFNNAAIVNSISQDRVFKLKPGY